MAGDDGMSGSLPPDSLPVLLDSETAQVGTHAAVRHFHKRDSITRCGGLLMSSLW
jgi:hypothetical protein